MNETLRDGRLSVYLQASRKTRLLRLADLMNVSASQIVQRALDAEFKRIITEILEEKNQHDQTGN
jgi:hypothetical protein